MKRIYEMRIEIVVDDAHRESIIREARHRYMGAGGSWTVDDEGNERRIPAEEFIQSVDDGLIELIDRHLGFESEGLELNSITCDTEETAREFVEVPDDAAEQDDLPSETLNSGGTSLAGEEDAADDLDEYEADLYLCRWPNGDFSIVGASSKREAILALDEWAGAHPSQLHPLDSFKADFGLTDEGEIVLHEFGEETRDVIWDICYPELSEVLTSEDVTDSGGNFKPGGRKRVAEAVKHERSRLWENQPRDLPETELGKRIAERMGTSATVADYYVEETAKRILESDQGEGGKPN